MVNNKNKNVCAFYTFIKILSYMQVLHQLNFQLVSRNPVLQALMHIVASWKMKKSINTLSWKVHKYLLHESQIKSMTWTLSNVDCRSWYLQLSHKLFKHISKKARPQHLSTRRKLILENICHTKSPNHYNGAYQFSSLPVG